MKNKISGNNRPRQAACKVCGIDAAYKFSQQMPPHILDIFLCPGCGLLFIGNQFSDQELGRAYELMDFKHYYQERELTTQEKSRRVADNLDSIIRQGGNSFALLDVGCGYGHLLEELRQRFPGLGLAGQELPGDSASACQGKGLRVFTSPLEDIREKFSVISLIDVAEHLPQPNLTFKNCYGLLKESGYIYIHTPRRCFWDNFFLTLINTPGFLGLSRLWFGTRLSIFHLQLWSEGALKAALEKAGFRLIYIKPERELSWPLDSYVKNYLGERLKQNPALIRLITGIIKFFLIRLGTLKNKAICLAEK